MHIGRTALLLVCAGYVLEFKLRWFSANRPPSSRLLSLCPLVVLLKGDSISWPYTSLECEADNISVQWEGITKRRSRPKKLESIFDIFTAAYKRFWLCLSNYPNVKFDWLTKWEAEIGEFLEAKTNNNVYLERRMILCASVRIDNF